MEQHGNNPQQNVVVLIPARYLSTRLPGKLMLEISGVPLILHTVGQAEMASNVDRVVVATDDERILGAVVSSGREAVMTSNGHLSGSDRIAEVAENLPAGTIVVNVQGDEPLISPRTIELAVEAMLSDGAASIVTTSEPIVTIDDVLSPDVVKVVTDQEGTALYFSRSPVPFPREAAGRNGDLRKALENEPGLMANFRKHTGIYVYRREYLLEFTRASQGQLEQIEMLEQLRALESGARIKVVEAPERSIGVDNASDLERVRQLIEGR